ncbi:F-box domain protein [Necator americanus]|uniref:F-box domain protein n=1 Tax=Necator americanus TaxID=51031 RepID=W2SPA0_NECAM|nr:F-box domain protein [Necator americanus]ETN71333.1 F-box domain protein [Necator americanus]
MIFKSHQQAKTGPRLPVELLFQILNGVDRETALNCRAVCTRWHEAIDKIKAKNKIFPSFELSRLVITGVPRKGLEIRCVAYDAQRASAIVIPHSMLRRRADLGFNFGQFKVQRIVLKSKGKYGNHYLQNLLLTDEFVDFLRIQLSHCNLSPLVQLSLHGVDFSSSNSLTLHRLLALVAKNIEILEVNQSTGMRADSITDAHLAQLDAKKIRRVAIDGVRFTHAKRRGVLRVGNESLRRFAAQKNFPILVLDRCSVTTKTVCDYTEEWFASAAESEKSVRSQICTVKRCAAVKGPQFEVECQRRGLHCKRRRGSGSLILYNIQAEHAHTEFTVATQPLEADEPKKEEEQQ